MNIDKVDIFRKETYFKVDIDLIEHIMDSVTGDEYCNIFAPGDYRFWNYHADICTQYFANQDWCWEEAINYWSEDMIIEAILAYDDICFDMHPITDAYSRSSYIPEVA